MPANNTKQNTPLKKLHSLYQQTKDSFYQTHTDASQWLQKKSIGVEDFRTRSQQLLAATSLAGSVFVNKPVDVVVQEQLQALQDTQGDEFLSIVTQEEKQVLLKKLHSFVALPPGHLEYEDERYLEQQLSDILGFTVTAELDGHRLNHSIGVMGGEQHLRRFPTDELENHEYYQEAGIADHRGAFGWFTQNGELTTKAIEYERYYFAVQTMYLPNWNQEYAQLKPWFKFRKMIMINPADQRAVVGVIGDAGPAQWVQKQFGGSPEVIREGKIWSPAAKGRVMMLFVDDPQDEVPLGPINLSVQQTQVADAERNE